MKKIYAFVVLALVTSAVYGSKVTFQVDMSNETVSGDGVHIAGSFQAADGASADWQPGETMLTDPDQDGIYTYTADIPDGTYQYKFLNGNAWGTDEGVPGSCAVSNNREVVVSGDVTIPVVCFGLCIACPSAVDTADVVFKVDMSMETVSANGVHIAGDFAAGGYAAWDPAAIALSDSDMDNVYEVTLRLPQGSYPFKFVNGNAWGSDESIPAECAISSNREVIVEGDNDEDSELLTDKITFLTAYGNCPPQDSVDYTFKLDLNYQMVSPNGVHLAGAFGSAGYAEWDPSGIELTDTDNDNIYDVTLRLPEGTYPHKFVNGNAWGSDEGIPTGCAVNGNREVTISGDGDAFSDILTGSSQVCFGKCLSDCEAPLPPVTVTFRVDLNDEIVDASGVYVSGDFMNPAWVKDSLEMTDEGNGVYSIDVDVVPGEYQFKFFNGDGGDDDGETADLEAGGCGAANAVGGWNRVLNIEGLEKDTTLPAWKYNSCALSTAAVQNVLSNQVSIYPNPANKQVTITLAQEVGNVSITMMDLTGRTLISTSAFNGTATLQWGKIQTGVYLIRLEDANGQSALHKVVVE